MSFFPFDRFRFQKELHLGVCVCVCVCVSMLCMLPKYFNPVVTLQAPAHTTSVTVSTTSPQFSANKFHFCALKDRHFFLSLSRSSVPCHSFPAPITSHLSACLFSAVSTLFIICALFCLKQSGIRRSYKTANGGFYE